MQRVVPVLALAVAAACASSGPSWEKPGGTSEQLSADMADCESRAVMTGDIGTRGPTNRARVGADYDRCMQQRGWVRVR